MSDLADIIVDIPTQQTDKFFTYIIPKKWKKIIKIGMRVEVSFGKRASHIQGFVIKIYKKEIENSQLKTILKILDLTPILNKELLKLSDYMHKKTLCFKINCLKNMVPTVMRKKYIKKLILLDENHPIKKEFFIDKNEIEWKRIQKREILKTIQSLIKERIIEVKYSFKDSYRVPKKRMVKNLLTLYDYEKEEKKVSKKAFRQKQLLCLLYANKRQKISFYIEKGITHSLLKKGEQKGWLKLEDIDDDIKTFSSQSFNKSEPFILNIQQKQVLKSILNFKKHKTILLQGITGSGKTEVYLQLTEKVLEKRKTAIVLVPEISLIPQIFHWFKSRFGNEVAVFHSGLSEMEKYNQLRKIIKEEAKIVIGTRSAIFSPLKKIGVIIIDEEHDLSYKQDEVPRYHARDLAIWRAKYNHCPVILGSATPSLESRARAQKNVYHLLTLDQRAKSYSKLPIVNIVDMKNEFSKKNSCVFSNLLKKKIQDRLIKNEQIVLMLNRRGYSTYIICRDCGYVLTCKNCNVSLTLHISRKQMCCHYCNHKESIPINCFACTSSKIRSHGVGTEKVERELKNLFPQASTLRMDVDTTKRKGAHQSILESFGDKKAQILLGTQMISKGLDFPNVTLVGVLNADTSLNFPDFRSNERTFQLLTQVSGRAGRGKKLGEVVIQTLNPTHHSIMLSKFQDYENFYKKEMKIRHQQSYPPYYFLTQIKCSHEDENLTIKTIYKIYQNLKYILSQDTLILGPSPTGIFKIKNRYYYQILIKYKNEPNLIKYIKKILKRVDNYSKKGVYVSVDVDPMHFN